MSCPVIELTQQLIRRPSLSPDDAGCQALMIERLRAIGFTVERMDFGDTRTSGRGAARVKRWPLPGILTSFPPVTRIAGSTRRLSRLSATACCLVAARQT